MHWMSYNARCVCMKLSKRRHAARIPDAPEELFRIPYEAAESDAIRYALIYHNGGVYMDTDFLAIDMTSIIDRTISQQHQRQPAVLSRLARTLN